MKTFVDAQIKHAPSNVKPRRASRAINPLATCAVIVFVGFLASIACAVPSFAQIVGTVQLNIERRGHTATLLEDGKVLIVGGDNQSGIVNQVELLDPASQTSSLADMPIVARTDHTATRLADGRVLIIGGRDQNGSLTSTEIYNPLTATFTAGASLTTPRSGHTTTVLANGNILVAAGDVSGSAELYNPTTQSFSLIAGSMNTARKFQSAILLNNGQVLIAGGVGAQNNVLNTAEVYDPSSQSFYLPPTLMQTPRAFATLKLLADGKVQIIGGDTDLSMEVFDPTDGIFIARALLPPNADLLDATLSTQSRAALFSPMISQDPLLQGVLTPEQLALLDRADHSITELPSRNQVLVAGGINSAGQTLNSANLVSSSSASVTTDKTDYAPGQIVTITGSGFQPNEQVAIYFHEFPEEYPDIFFSVAANQQGNFVTAEFAPQQIDLGRVFTLTAIGQTSGFTAQTAFKDSNAKLTVTVTGNGRVGSSPPGIDNCRSGSPAANCFENYTITTPALNVTLTPTADSGSVFVGWGGACSGAGSCVVAMNNDKSVTATFNTVAATTTAISAPTITYNDNGSVTVTVSSAAGTVTGNVSLSVDGGTTISKALSSGSATFASTDIAALASPSAGDHSLSANYAAQGNFAASSATGNLHVNQASSTTVVTFEAGPYTYRGTAFTATAVVTGIGGLNQAVAVVYTGDCTNVTSTNGCTATATFDGDTNHTGSSDSKAITINQAPSVTSVTCPASVTYNGAAQTPCSATVTGPGGLNQSLTVNYTNNINAGMATASASYAGDTNYTGSKDSKDFNIEKAAVTATAGSGSATYDGTTKSPSACTVTGVYTGDLSCTNDPLSVGPDAGTTPIVPVLSGTALTNFDVTSVNGSYTINKAPSVTAVTVSDATYDGSAHGGTANVTGAGGLSQNLTVSYSGRNGTVYGPSTTAPTNAGDYTASASFAGDTNHTGSSDSKDYSINKAPSVTVVTVSDAIYDGSAHGGTANVTGAGGLSQSLTVSYNGRNGTVYGPSTTAPTNAGDYTASASFAGDTNHTGSSDSKDYSINKAASTTVVTFEAGPYTYRSTAFTATAVVTGAGGLNQAIAVDYSGDCTQVTSTNGCTATATFAGDANHTGSSDNKSITITTAFVFNGFYSPIGGSVESGNGGSYANPVRSFKLGSTIPVKFGATWLNGGAPLITGIHTLQAVKYSNATDSDAPIDATPTDAATTGNQFRLTSPDWHFNLSTKGFSAGTWLLIATLEDGSRHTVWISIKK
ncbi:MAG TPA: kelch repeat-containing protein [Candidatus Binatia bacterium]|nr:kelch repeat-containing protein [Candidatus Binatia bacterium]